MAGILSVDFAGTKAAAIEFASTHSTPVTRLRVGNKPNITPEGGPMITTYYTTRNGRTAAIMLLEQLGWGDGEFIENEIGQRLRR